MKRSTLLICCLAAACGERAAPRDAAAPAPPVPPAPAAPWRASPPGAQVSRSGDTVLIATGPHVVAWDPALGELAPPYAVSATLHKHTGRLHEAVGLVFGGSGLEGPEAGQQYSYFMVRGDGSYLIKNRRGPATPVVRDWTRHPAIRRDVGEVGRPNLLEVRVEGAEVSFRVNGAEVARVPAMELSLAGRAGVRVSHDVELAVVGFQAGGRP